MGSHGSNKIISSVTIVILILGMLLSAFVVSDYVSTPAFNAKTLQSLDDKEKTVLKLAGAAAASSTALTLIPGNVAQPVADQIAKLTQYFVVILSAIVLEKMLLSIIGYVVFTFVIPIGLLFGIAYVLTKQQSLLLWAVKLMIFGGVLFIAIPASVHVSDLIDQSYQASISKTIETVEANKGFIEEKKQSMNKTNQSWFSQIGSFVVDVTTKLGADLKSMVEKGENSLTALLEAVAVLIVTSCLIPILVILGLFFLVKMIFKLDVVGMVKPLKVNHNHDL